MGELLEKVPSQKLETCMEGTQVGKTKESDKSHGKSNGYSKQKEEDE
jgi:hypothetical protein